MKILEVCFAKSNKSVCKHTHLLCSNFELQKRYAKRAIAKNFVTTSFFIFATFASSLQIGKRRLKIYFSMVSILHANYLQCHRPSLALCNCFFYSCWFVRFYVYFSLFITLFLLDLNCICRLIIKTTNITQ